VDLLHALHDLGLPARFVVFGAYPEPVDDLRPVFEPSGGSWRYAHLPRAAGFAASYRDHLRLAAALARVRADLCHSLHTFVPAVAPCPVVVTIQDLMYELFADYAEAVRSRPYRVLRWGTRRRARRVLCPSASTAADLVRLWAVPRSRIDVVPHGLRAFGAAGQDCALPSPVTRLESCPTASLARLGSGPVLTSPLNLEPRKNLLALLQAFALLRPRFPQGRLALYGKASWSDDRERQYRVELARLGLAEAVIEPGLLTDRDLAWLYRRSTVFVFPTLYEGFGYPALEAMAAGTCCVVRGCSAMAEVVGPAGVQVEPLAPASLAEAVAGLLLDESRRRRLGEEARLRAREFTAARMARGTFDAYLRALRPVRVGS
jgi:glycosyltransferase involved in cell wall biosynthesis